MFSPHRRCESIESLLRARIVDLEEQNSRLYERLEEQTRTHSSREMEMVDRFIATNNPTALRELAAAARAATPAAAMPSMVRTPMTASPGLHAMGQPPARVRLTPDSAGFRGAGGVPQRPQNIATSAAPAVDDQPE